LQIQNQYHFDVFNVYHIGLNSAFRGLPTIITWLGSPPNHNIFRKFVANSWINTLKRNKKTIVISNYLKKQLDGKGIGSRIIYCGVSSDFKPSRKDKEYMLYVGRLEKHKNIAEIIKLSKETNFKLKIAGYGPEESRLKRQAVKIQAPVEFLGRVSRKELINLYQECSFFISASKWEGFGLIFLEAAACGKPSVAYNAGSISEIILNDKTGFLVENYENFKNKAGLLIKDKDLRKKLGKNALKFSKSFKWEEIAKEYEKILGEAAKK